MNIISKAVLATRVAIQNICISASKCSLKPLSFLALLLIVFFSLPVDALENTGKQNDVGAVKDADLRICTPRYKSIEQGDYRTVERGWNAKLDTYFRAPEGAKIKVVRYWLWMIPISEQEQTLTGHVWKKLSFSGFKEIFNAKMQILAPNGAEIFYYACPNGVTNITPEISHDRFSLKTNVEQTGNQMSANQNSANPQIVEHPAYVDNYNSCERYAYQAIRQNEANKALGSEFKFPVWSSDYYHHYNWCRHGKNASKTGWEMAERERALQEYSVMNDLLPCERYAREAVRHYHVSRVFNSTEFLPPVWSDSYSDHLTWCQADNIENSIDESSFREEKLQDYAVKFNLYEGFDEGLLSGWQKTGTAFNNQPNLVERWAPIIYADIAQSGGRCDYLVAVNFDGDWTGLNNHHNIKFPEYKALATVYYSLVKTETHTFIGYYFYHAKDCAKGEIGIGSWHYGHEHDMEGVIIAVNNISAEVDAMLTTVHGDYIPYVSRFNTLGVETNPQNYYFLHNIVLGKKIKSNVLKYSDADTFSMTEHATYNRQLTIGVGIEAQTHAVWGRFNNKCIVGPSGSPSGCDNSHGGDGIVYYYDNRAEEPTSDYRQYPDWKRFSYDLRDMGEIFVLANQDRFCGHWGTDALFDCGSNGPPWTVFNSWNEDKGNPPWAWGMYGVIHSSCEQENLFLTPDAIFNQYFNWPDGTFATNGEYLINEYAPFCE